VSVPVLREAGERHAAALVQAGCKAVAAWLDGL
jgi:hypothetical protein